MLSVGKQRAFAEWHIVPGYCKLALQLRSVKWDGVRSSLEHGDVAAVPARVSYGMFFNGGNSPWQ